jgi:NADH pyrophosphatase NudC (nudix superfamily)
MFDQSTACQDKVGEMLDLHVVTLVVATLAVGWLMAMAGLQKSALEWRRRRRICPSCGREIEHRVCSSCT